MSTIVRPKLCMRPTEIFYPPIQHGVHISARQASLDGHLFGDAAERLTLSEPLSHPLNQIPWQVAKISQRLMLDLSVFTKRAPEVHRHVRDAQCGLCGLPQYALYGAQICSCPICSSAAAKIQEIPENVWLQMRILIQIYLHKTPVFCALGCTWDQFKFSLNKKSSSSHFICH